MYVADSGVECNLPLMTGLDVDPGEAALGHFMHNYVASSPFSYLPTFYNFLLNSYPEIDLVVSVPGLVLLSQHLRQPSILRHAYARYAIVLEKTQKALDNTDIATLDSTLISILLLSLFEALILQGRRNTRGWHMHIQGCATLLHLRGAEQFTRPLGWHLFLHSSNSIRSSCISQCMKIPNSLKVLQEKAPLVTGTSYLALQLGFMLDNFADLRARWPCLIFSQRLQNCRNLNEEIETLIKQLHQIAPFQRLSNRTSNLPSEHSAYGDEVDWYNSVKHAKRWNTVRTIEIMLNEYICSALTQQNGDISAHTSSLDTLSDDELQIYRIAAYRSEQAIHGILRSVPFYLELSESSNTSPKSLIFPLTSIVTSQLASISAKLFARDRLGFISSAYGNAQADEAAKISIDSNSMEDW